MVPSWETTRFTLPTRAGAATEPESSPAPTVAPTPATPVSSSVPTKTIPPKTIPPETIPTPQPTFTFLEVVQGEVGKSGIYTEGGFWCAKFVSWATEQVNLSGWNTDSPSTMHVIADEKGLISDQPVVGGLIFIDLFGGDPSGGGQITHVAVVESVQGAKIGTIEGNADGSDVVIRKVRHLNDGYVVAFSKALQ